MHFGRDLVRSFLLGGWDGLSLFTSHVERLFVMVEKGVRHSLRNQDTLRLCSNIVSIHL